MCVKALLQLRKNPGKNFNQENWPDQGSNSGLLGERQRCYPLDHSGGIITKNTNIIIIVIIIINWVAYTLRPHGRSENFYGDRNRFEVGLFIRKYIIILIIRVLFPKASPSCKRRNQRCSSAESRSSPKTQELTAVAPGMNRFGSLPLLSAPHSLSLASEQTLEDLKTSQGTNVVLRRVDWANWSLRTSSKFTTGVKYQFHQGFWRDQRSGNPNHPSPPMTTI